MTSEKEPEEEDPFEVDEECDVAGVEEADEVGDGAEMEDDLDLLGFWGGVKGLFTGSLVPLCLSSSTSIIISLWLAFAAMVLLFGMTFSEEVLTVLLLLVLLLLFMSQVKPILFNRSKRS
jgi:hypothetical protein